MPVFLYGRQVGAECKKRVKNRVLLIFFRKGGVLDRLFVRWVNCLNSARCFLKYPDVVADKGKVLG